MRIAAGAAMLGALALAGCGGGDGGDSRTAAATATATETAPAATAPASETARTETPGAGGSGGSAAPKTPKPKGGPERRQGGAGDEIPASSQALITGRGGRLAPRTVRVPPFIAIRVELRSADGATYVLRGRGRSLQVGGVVSSRATTFAGLKSGAKLSLSGPQGRVTVVADAEPGP